MSAYALRLAGAAMLFATAPAFAAETAQAPIANATAEAGGSSATSKPKKAKKDNSDLICKSFPSTESRMKTTKVCRTREEWRKADFQR